MNLLSLVFAVIGTITTLVHYTNHAISMGVFSFILLLASFVLGTVGMKKQEKNGGVQTEVFNSAMLGHGISSVVLIVCGIMCLIANIH